MDLRVDGHGDRVVEVAHACPSGAITYQRKDGHADEAAPPSADDLDRTCLDAIARFKRPKGYRFVDSLPTNNYGKVLKRELRERLQAEQA